MPSATIVRYSSSLLLAIALMLFGIGLFSGCSKSPANPDNTSGGAGTPGGGPTGGNGAKKQPIPQLTMLYEGVAAGFIGQAIFDPVMPGNDSVMGIGNLTPGGIDTFYFGTTRFTIRTVQNDGTIILLKSDFSSVSNAHNPDIDGDSIYIRLQNDTTLRRYSLVKFERDNIGDWRDLQAMRQSLRDYYYLSNDIFLPPAGYKGYPAQGFDPIGNGTDTLINGSWHAQCFSGGIDGRGHSVNNLWMIRKQESVGLIGYMDSTTMGIKDLTINIGAAGIHGSNPGSNLFLGALAGRMMTVGEIKNVKINIGGTVSVDGIHNSIHQYIRVGGLIGQLGVYSAARSMAGCTVFCDVSDSASTSSIMGSVGGMVGEAGAISISDCHFYGNVTGGFVTDFQISPGLNGPLMTGSLQAVGGLIGVSTANLTKCSSSGTVNGSSRVGGLVGVHGSVFPSRAFIISCYSNSVVNGYDMLGGGLVGCIGGTGRISDSYAVGNVTQITRNGVTSTSNQLGGLVGLTWANDWNTILVSNCYSAGRVIASYVNNNDPFIGLQVREGPAQFPNNFCPQKSSYATQLNIATTSQSTFSAAGFDFTSTWKYIPGAWPQLAWQ